MYRRILHALLAVALLQATSNDVQAKTKTMPTNVKMAAKAMFDAANMVRKGSTNSGGCHGSYRNMDGASHCQGWYTSFGEKLSFYVSVHPKVIYVAIRGTDSAQLSNTVMNTNARRVRTRGKKGYSVHRGWWRASGKVWKEVKPLLQKHYRPGRRIIFTGQSMGGALAAYVAHRALKSNATKHMEMRVVTFGAPRYAQSVNFFPKVKNLYVYTLEHKYRKKGKGRWLTDKVVYAWKWPGIKPVTPKNSRRQVWTYKCKTHAVSQKQAHGSSAYYHTGKDRLCDL